MDNIRGDIIKDYEKRFSDFKNKIMEETEKTI